MVQTFEDYYPHIKGSDKGSLFYLKREARKQQQEAWINLRDHEFKGLPLPVGDAVMHPPVHAVVRQDRWVAFCPGCNSCQRLAEEAQWFYCHECQNRGAGAPFCRVPVLWPLPDVKARIEALLDARPAVFARSWDPRASVDQLIRENRQQGWPIPEGAE